MRIVFRIEFRQREYADTDARDQPTWFQIESTGWFFWGWIVLASHGDQKDEGTEYLGNGRLTCTWKSRDANLLWKLGLSALALVHFT